MERVFYLVLGLVALSGTLFCLRHRSPLHLAIVLAAFTLFVGNFFPIATLFVEPSSWRNVVQAPERDLLGVQREYAAFAFGLFGAAMAAFALGVTARKAPANAEARPTRSDALVATALVLGGAVLYVFFVRTVGIDALSSRDDYAEKYLRSVGLGPLASGINVMILGVLWAEAGELEARAKYAFRAVAIAICVWTLAVISVRTNFVILALGYAWIVCARRGITVARVRPALLAMAVCGWFSLELVSLWRGAVKEAGLDRATEMLVRNVDANLSAVVGGSEFSHPFLTALEVRTHAREGELGGASYWNAIPALAPLALVPDRPPALAQKFANENYAEFAEQGGGTAFSLVAEAWLNFGRIGGALLVGFLCGAALIALEAAARRWSSGTLARVVPYFTFLCITAHRSEFAVLLKQVVVIAIPIAIVLVLVDLLQPALRAREHRRAAVEGA